MAKESLTTTEAEPIAKSIDASDLLQKVIAENNSLKEQIAELKVHREASIAMLNKHPQEIYNLEVQLAVLKSKLEEVSAELSAYTRNG